MYPAATVSKRELNVLDVIPYNNATKEIAERLFLSNQSAITYHRNLMDKHDAHFTARLVRRGLGLGLLNNIVPSSI
jgi:DNA-binding NarL/FixJ family response regulator